MSDAAPRLIALRCPKCQEPLPAHPGEVLFVCAKCPTAVDASAGALMAYALHFEGGAHPWWQLAGTAHVKQFVATQSARTPLGTVTTSTKTLPVRFLVPADDRPIAEAYRAALASVTHTPAPVARSGSAKNGIISRADAEAIARQVFLTLVARADGKVHFIDFSLELPERAIVLRAE